MYTFVVSINVITKIKLHSRTKGSSGIQLFCLLSVDITVVFVFSYVFVCVVTVAFESINKILESSNEEVINTITHNSAGSVK